MKFRDVEKVRSIIELATGLEISHTSEDCVFPHNSSFFIQFDNKKPNVFHCFFEANCDEIIKQHILGKLNEAGSFKNCRIKFKGLYNLKSQGEVGEVQLNW